MYINKLRYRVNRKIDKKKWGEEGRERRERERERERGK